MRNRFQTSFFYDDIKQAEIGSEYLASVNKKEKTYINVQMWKRK